MEGIQPTYNMAERGHYDDGFGFGGGSGLWLFAILALMWGGNGFFGNRGGCGYGERCATVEDINNANNFTRLEAQVRANENLIQGGIANLGNGICNLGYQLATDFGALSKEMSECCCGINRNIDALRYEGALSTASINSNTTAQVQKVLDKLCENEINTLRSRVSYLETQSLVQPPRAVPAYPTCNPYTGTYGYGCGCGSTNI